MTMNKKVVGAAVAAVLGTVAAPQAAMADVITADWAGVFTMLDAGGTPLANSSITTPSAKNPGNNLQTQVSGTITFNTTTGAGSATLVPFDFFSGSAPAEAVGIDMQAIGNGSGGPGSLVMANMLFNWNGTNGIPVSLIMDAAGFFGGLQGGLLGDGDLTQAEVAGFGATPASDGIYVGFPAGLTGTGNGPGGAPGYLALGPVPISSTGWNTTNAAGCSLGADANFADNTGGGCMGIAPSGTFPLVFDTSNPGGLPDYSANTGGDIGGTPMQDGPFQGSNANFDITSMTNIVITSEVPVPAAVWLFGSGLLGLVGVARRRKA